MTPPPLLHRQLELALQADLLGRRGRPAPRPRTTRGPGVPDPRLRAGRAPGGDRVLATLLFTDIVGSTARAAQLGDRAWRELLAAHDRVVRALVARHRGRLVKTTGDGSLAAFERPGEAVAGALAIRDAVATLGLEIRAGVHAGECERLGRDLGGLAVHIGARVAASADPGEIRVSRTVADLLTGVPMPFEPRGAHVLRGVPGRWELFALAG
jgi:class 3 adenylate cyclase